MLKLMKYEFKKTMFSKMILLVITALAQILFLGGLFLNWEDGLGIGIGCLILCAWFGILYIGIESMLVLHKDLNTKQSYMLFLTPQSCYKILGAKILENGLSIFIAGVFFALLAAVDVSCMVIYHDGIKGALELLRQMSFVWKIDIPITPEQAALIFFTALASWLMVVVIGYFAIVLCATVFCGRRFSGFVSFVIFLIISSGFNALLGLIPAEQFSISGYAWIVIISSLVISAAVYLASGWVMEKRLSV